MRAPSENQSHADSRGHAAGDYFTEAHGFARGHAVHRLGAFASTGIFFTHTSRDRVSSPMIFARTFVTPSVDVGS